MKNFSKRLRDGGELVGAEGLASPGQAKLVRAGRTARRVTDGPFAKQEFSATDRGRGLDGARYAIAAEASACRDWAASPSTWRSKCARMSVRRSVMPAARITLESSGGIAHRVVVTGRSATTLT